MVDGDGAVPAGRYHAVHQEAALKHRGEKTVISREIIPTLIYRRLLSKTLVQIHFILDLMETETKPIPRTTLSL